MSVSSPLRNVENIRRLNLADNQLFLRTLLINDIRTDFLDSARTLHRVHRTLKNTSNQENRVEYMTRYHKKVVSGEIVPRLPEWQRLAEKKQKSIEEKLFEREKRRQLRQAELEKRREEKLFERELKRIAAEQRRAELQRKQEEQRIQRQLRRMALEKRREEKERQFQERLFLKELRFVEEQIKREEQIKIRRARAEAKKDHRWKLLYQNGNPYQRAFRPRNTLVDQRIRHNLYGLL